MEFMVRDCQGTEWQAISHTLAQVLLPGRKQSRSRLRPESCKMQRHSGEDYGKGCESTALTQHSRFGRGLRTANNSCSSVRMTSTSSDFPGSSTTSGSVDSESVLSTVSSTAWCISSSVACLSPSDVHSSAETGPHTPETCGKTHSLG